MEGVGRAIMESEMLTAVSRWICHMGPHSSSLSFLDVSVIFCFGGNIPIAVGMLDGFNHHDGFRGEEPQHRRRCWRGNS